MADFATKAKISMPRMQMVESGVIPPDRDTLLAYLEVCAPDLRTRTHVRDLWTRSKSQTATDAEQLRAAAALEDVVAAMERDMARRMAQLSTPTEPYMPAVSSVDHPEPDPVTPAEVRYSIAKPAWRRSNETSQANSNLWPNPDDITTVDEFTAAMRTIKNSTGMSYTALSEASRRNEFPLARSTIHALCSRPKLPTSNNSVACFIKICGGTITDMRRWNTTWQRLVQAANSSAPAISASPTVAAPADIIEDQAPKQSKVNEDTTTTTTTRTENESATRLTNRRIKLIVACVVVWLITIVVSVLATLAVSRPDLF